MSTTVRISNLAKARIRRLQERWRRARGEQPTQQSVLEKGLEYLEEHAGDFVSNGGWRPLTAEEIEDLRALQGDYGDLGLSEIDDVVYGDVA